MSTDTWKLEKDLCRCCHAEGSFYDLSEPRCNLGQTEVYSKMLKHCFDLEVTPVTGVLSALTFTICESCVLRLRDASNFKRQVQSCEERFKNMYKNAVQVMISEGVEVKEEAPVIEELKQEKMDDDEDYCDVPVNDDDEEDNKTVYELKVEDAKKAKAKPKPKPKSKPRPKKPPPKKAGRPRKSPEPPKEGDEKDAEETNSKRPNSYTVTAIDDNSDYTCGICMYTLTTEKGIRYHMMRTHSMVECLICDDLFESHRDRNTHLKEKHEVEVFDEKKVEDDIMCAVCGNEYIAGTKALNMHVIKCHKLINCHDCDAKITRSTLAGHMHKKHGSAVATCGVCGQKGLSNTAIIHHHRMVHLKEKNVSCKRCGLKFYDKSSLNKHMICHRNTKEFQCSFCQKKFARRTTLTQHEKIHLGVKNKICAACGERFVQKASLNYHMLKHHPEAC